MFSEDYLIRILRQATAVMAKIIGLKNAGQYQEALKDIDQALELLVGIDGEMIRLLDDESLYILLTKNDVMDLEKLGFIADLFKEEGDIYELQNQNNEGMNCYIRSLTYYLIISMFPEASSSTEISQKINKLLSKVNSDYFEEKTLWNLFTYYENSGEFTKADDILSKLVSKTDSKTDIVDEMKSFYRRILEKTPTELAKSGLTRTQIRKKLQNLNQYH